MDNLEKPYDTEIKFIECTVCEKSIRGEDLYKIHLTSSGHLKREELLLVMGVDVKPQNLPRFQNILQYLDYLKLEEPIIGLSFVEELPPDDAHGLRYMCKLCSSSAGLTETVNHLIGRKHRLKYLNTKRPDLVTWDKMGPSTQAGKLIRAKAEIIERQDGRGTPVLQNVGNKGKLNYSRGPQRQNQNWGRTMPQNQNPPGNVPPLLPGLKNYVNFSNQRRYPEDQPNKPAFQPDEHGANRGRWSQWEENVPKTADYTGSHMYRDSMHSDHYGEHEDQYAKDPLRRPMFEQGDAPRYDYLEKMSHGQAWQVDRYPGEQLSYDSSYQERDAPNDFYSDERGWEWVGSPDYEHPHQAYLKDKHQRWSREREPDRSDSMYSRERQALSEPEAKRRSFHPLVDSEQEHNHAFSIIRDYQHERRNPLGEETLDYTEPGGAGASTSHRQVKVTRTISNIPEPFRRFLTNADGNDSHVKRKRKSRFSDATPEEMERTQDMYNAGGGHIGPNFGSEPSLSSRSEDSGMHYSDNLRESQNPHYTEGYQRGGAHSDGVFDLLKNIEIENADEADFLKNKLCSLLKEFKSKKAEKESHDSYSRSNTSRNYSDSKLGPELPRHPLYENPPSEEPKDHHFDKDHRRKPTPESQHQEYPDRSLDKSRQSSRSRYEGMFEKAHASKLDEPPYYPERFQEPLRSHDYQPAVEEFYDSPLPMGQEGPRTHREQRYSNTLDKITSTLLELVSRK